MENNKSFGISSSTLHLIAIISMILDHSGFILWPYCNWLRWIGRLAFPIFAFMIVEGHKRTSSNKKYCLRLFIMALISEVPFNLMCCGNLWCRPYQNVMWTLLIGLMALNLCDFIDKKRGKGPFDVLNWTVGIFAYCIAEAISTDYGGAGVLIILLFALFDKTSMVGKTGQLIGLSLISWYILGGFRYNFIISDAIIEIPMQILCVLSLIPIWIYNGEKGYNAVWFRWFIYLVYPVHILLLVWIRLLVF